MLPSLENLQEVRNKIRNSPVGEKLSTIERWSGFRSSETTDKWVLLLGPTAVVLSHQEYFTDFVLKWAEELDPDTRETLVLAASIHDLGEAISGDISAYLKTPDDENNEHLHAIATLKEIEFAQNTMNTLEKAYKLVVLGENQALNFIFKALERTEYLDTGIHLFLKLQGGEQMDKGYYMIARILAFDLPKILKYALKLPNIIGEYLHQNSELISEMFVIARASVEDDFQQNYDESLSEWHKFISSNRSKL